MYWYCLVTCSDTVSDDQPYVRTRAACLPLCKTLVTQPCPKKNPDDREAVDRLSRVGGRLIFADKMESLSTPRKLASCDRIIVTIYRNMNLCVCLYVYIHVHSSSC